MSAADVTNQNYDLALEDEGMQIGQQSNADQVDYTSVSNSLIETLGAMNSGIKVDEKSLSTGTSSFDKRIFEEVQMCSLNGGITGVNQIYTDHNRTQVSRIGSIGASRWSQVFDLFNTLIVCMVDGSEMAIHVIHLTEEKLDEFAHSLSSTNMPLSQEKQYEAIKTKFDAYKSANFQFHGMIVPNVHMRQNVSKDAGNCAAGGESYPYTITLATSLNLIYEIDLSPYYLKMGETVQVIGPNQILYSDQSLAQNSILRTFEMTKDLKSQQELQIFGLGMSQSVHQNVSKDIGMTLKVHYVEGNTDFSESSQGLVKGYFNQFGSVAGKLSRGIQNGVGQVQQFIRPDDKPSYSNFRTAQTNDVCIQKYQQRGDEIGVVAVKVFPIQGLICAVFSDGSFKIKAACAEADVKRTAANNVISINLLKQGFLPKCFAPSEKVHITNAKICHTRLSNCMVLGIAFQIENFGDLRKIWRLTKYQMPNNSNIFESQLNLISQQEFQDTRNPSCSLIHLRMEKFLSADNQEHFSTQAYFWNDQMKIGKFVDVSSDTVIIDIQEQEDFTTLLDKLQSQFMDGSEQDAVRLRSSITKLYRFSPQAIQQALKTSVGGWQGRANKSILTQLLDVVKRLTPERIKELQFRIIKEQNENSQVLCVEKSQVLDQYQGQDHSNDQRLQELPVSIIVRPSGLSVVHQLNRFSYDFLDFSQRIDLQMKKLLQKDNSQGESESQVWLSSLQNESNHQTFLVGLFASVKMLISEQMFVINQSIIADPQNICHYFNQAFQSSFQHQDVQTGLEDLVQQDYEKIQGQIMKLQQTLLQYFNSYLPLKAKELEAGSSCIQKHHFQNYQATKDLLKTIEIKFLKDLDRLVGLLCDIIMVQQFMKTHSTFQAPIDDQIESQQTFLDQSLAIRFQQVLALKSVFQSQTVEIQMIGQQRTVVNQPKDSSVLSSLLCEDPRFFQKVSCIQQHISENAFDYVMSKYLGETREIIYLNCLSLNLIRFLDQNNFTKELSDYLALMPTLDQYDQNFEMTEDGRLQMIDLYIQDQIKSIITTQKSESMALLAYYRAYAAAKMDMKFKSSPVDLNLTQSQSFLVCAPQLQEDIFQQFVANIDECLNFLFSPEFNVDTSLTADKFSLLSQTHLQNDLLDTTLQHDTLKIIFTMHHQFSTLQTPSYSLYILNRTLKAISDNVLEASKAQKDQVLQAIFKICPNHSEENINLKYKSCYDIQSKELKHQQIMEFIEQTLQCQNIDSVSVIKQYTFDNQVDMEQVLQAVNERVCYLYGKRGVEKGQTVGLMEVDQKWGRVRKEVQGNDMGEDVYKEIQTYIGMMHLIGIVYDRCDQVSQMLNNFKKSVQDNIQRHVMPMFSSFEDLAETSDLEVRDDIDYLEDSIYKVYQKHLHVLLLALRSLDFCLEALGPEYILVEEVQEARKKCVGQKRTLEDSQMQDSSMGDESQSTTIFDISIKGKDEKLFDYELVRVSRADVTKEALLVAAKVKLAKINYHIDYSQSAKEEAEIVAQILVAEGQVEMALELSIQFNLHSISQCFEVLQANKDNSLIDQKQIASILERMNFEGLIAVSKHFILESHQFTPEMIKKIVDMKLAAQVVDCFLNFPLNSKQQLTSFYDLLTSNKQVQQNNILKQICEVDSRLSQKLLKTIPKCIQNSKNLADLQSNILKGLQNKKDKPDIDKAQDHYLEDKFEKQLLEQSLEGGAGNFGDLDLFMIVSEMEQRNDQMFDQIEDPRIKQEQEELEKLQILCANFQGLQGVLVNGLKSLQLGPPPTQIQQRRSLLPQNLM